MHVDGASSGRIGTADHGKRPHASAWCRLHPGTDQARAYSNRDRTVHRGRAQGRPAGARMDDQRRDDDQRTPRARGRRDHERSPSPPQRRSHTPRPRTHRRVRRVRSIHLPLTRSCGCGQRMAALYPQLRCGCFLLHVPFAQRRYGGSRRTGDLSMTTLTAARRGQDCPSPGDLKERPALGLAAPERPSKRWEENGKHSRPLAGDRSAPHPTNDLAMMRERCRYRVDPAATDPPPRPNAALVLSRHCERPRAAAPVREATAAVLRGRRNGTYWRRHEPGRRDDEHEGEALHG